LVKNKIANLCKSGDILDNLDINERIAELKKSLGNTPNIVIKELLLGLEQPLEAAVIYIDGLVNNDIVDRDLLNPIMLQIKEDLSVKEQVAHYLCKRYIAANTKIETDISEAVKLVKTGKTALIISGVQDIIVINSPGGTYRSIGEPENEIAIRGSREGFVENISTNISMIRRKIKDKGLVIENYTVGRSSQTGIALIYMGNIAEEKVIQRIRERIEAIDVDAVTGSGQVEQYIEYHGLTIFPQLMTTERPDKAVALIMEGRAAIIVEGTPFVSIAPSTFFDFFQAAEEYNERTIISSFIRALRVIATIIVITMPSVYLTLIKFNAELIPLNFITPIVKYRRGIALTPFLELLTLEIVIEILREGGIRLPTKIGQTLSVVSGIIIGDAAIKSQIVSPSSLFIIGIATASSFLIPNYDMALVIRFIKFPMLILANFLGIYGMAAGWFFLLAHLSALDSFGVPYFDFHKTDLKDIFIRAPLEKMNKRPTFFTKKNLTRQTNFKEKARNKDENSREEREP